MFYDFTCYYVPVHLLMQGPTSPIKVTHSDWVSWILNMNPVGSMIPVRDTSGADSVRLKKYSAMVLFNWNLIGDSGLGGC